MSQCIFLWMKNNWLVMQLIDNRFQGCTDIHVAPVWLVWYTGMHARFLVKSKQVNSDHGTFPHLRESCTPQLRFGPRELISSCVVAQKRALL